MSRHAQYPRFFVRKAADDRQQIAKAETPDDCQQYTVERGWHEYGSLLTGGRGIVAAGNGHTEGLNVEGDE